MNFVYNKTKVKPVSYIIDISIPQISNNHRLSIKMDNNSILNVLCNSEKNNNFDDSNYILEYKN